jgi:flavin reductase (DIM6/NTAB) family NADH-FMN oxidoreductase RutF
MGVDSDAFRNVMGRFATGVTVVTLPGETPHGITVNAFASVSLSPPLVMICIDHGTEAYELLENDVDGYAVNVLAKDQRELGEHFADIVQLDPGPFESERTRTEESGAPIFEESLAYVDCTVDAAHEAGDHTIYVGRANGAGVSRPEADPVTFYTGEWGTIAPDES